MEKRLTTKVQKISPKIPDSANNISNSLVIEPDDELSLEKKGTVYTVFDVSGKKQYDYLLVTKIVHDVLHDLYYQSENASPIQAVEKAILKLRDNIVKIVTDTNDSESLMSFNIATAILWGNTLYLIQYGSAEIHLMREGQIKPISAAKEGSFSVASGVIKDGDVVILATENFIRTFPPEKLINTAGLQLDNLDNLQTAMMLKFFVQKKFSNNEVIEFGVKNTQTPEPKKSTGIFSKLFKKQADTSTKVITPNHSSHKIFPLVMLFGLIAVIAIFASIYKTKTELASNTIKEVTITDLPTEKPQEDDTRSIDGKTVQVDAKVFYDVNLVSGDNTANEILILGDKLVATEETLGKVYVSDINSPKFVEQTYAFAGIKNISNIEGKLAFLDNDGFKIANLTTNDVEGNYAMEYENITATYLDFIYALNKDVLTRFVSQNGALNATVWAQDQALIGATSIAVNVSIFVLNNDEILKLTAGELDTFSLDEAYKLNKATQIVSNEELDNIYVADSGNKRILVMNDVGEVSQVIVHMDQKLWTDIRDITISADEKTMYLLDGSKVYEVPLKQLQL